MRLKGVRCTHGLDAAIPETVPHGVSLVLHPQRYRWAKNGRENVTSSDFNTPYPCNCAAINVKLYPMKVFFGALCLMLAFLPLRAQQDTVTRSDLYRFSDATVYTYARPIHWEKKDWMIFGGFLAGSAALTLLDQPANRLFANIERHFPNEIEEIGYHYGKPYSAVAFTSVFYLTGVLFKDRWARDTGLELGATLLTSGLLQTIMKDVIGRARPGTGVGHYRFKIPSKGSIAYHAFPSGHAAVAFGISIVMARRIESKPLKILFYSLAATTALSRMHSNDHWLSDIAFGAAMAWACNKAVARRLATNGTRNNRFGKISWSFTPGPQGLTFTGRFQ